MHECLDTTATVLVGFERVPFIVHKGLICRYGDFFRGAFDGRFKEGKDMEVELKLDSVKDFALFLHWLYAQSVHVPTTSEHKKYAVYEDVRKATTKSKLAPIGSGHAEVDSPLAREGIEERSVSADGDLENSKNTTAAEEFASAAPEDTTTKEISSTVQDREAEGQGTDDEDPGVDQKEDEQTQDCLVDLFVFADCRGVSGLRNNTMSLLTSQRDSDWSLLTEDSERVGRAYSSLSQGSAPCRYLVNEAACWWGADLADLGDYPTDFIADVLRAVLVARSEGKGLEPMWHDNMCILHDHVDTAEETACKAAKKGD
ncbi:hypothetical protein LTR36_010537 [Oleoguttula mirabilis]|uniref:BTB domain-containing protein n=1 Tax=Oleoguttula mirabilis TaxID=1507867 RepID=A0AAV9J4F4_9PEZI|nr:hypothetical protein LTR36_010537 [Oleoguttula mirabilis]